VRLTIERLRTLILVAGVVLIAALGVFLFVGRFRNPFNRKDLPQKLGMEIRQEANGVTYTQSKAGHTIFKIHASKVVELKAGNALLHDVKIELYGADGKRVDRIEGAEFEYNQKAGTALAKGQVELWMTKPGTEPPMVAAQLAQKSMPAIKEAASVGEVHVKTSGLSFDQQSGVAKTSERVEFDLTEGKGSSMGATFHTNEGTVALERAVELASDREGQKMHLTASHAEFVRDKQQVYLQSAVLESGSGRVEAGAATVDFRNDGTAAKLQAENGFRLATETGNRLASARGTVEFDEHNQPHHGHLEGGVNFDSVNAESGRHMTGASPAAELEFGPKGQIAAARLVDGVELQSEEEKVGGKQSVKLSRHWHSPQAEVKFRQPVGAAKVHKANHEQAEIDQIHGWGGVTVTSENHNMNGLKEMKQSTLMAADELVGEFGAGSQMRLMRGEGHARVEERQANGAVMKSQGDRIEAQMGSNGAKGSEVETARLEGHVVLTNHPVAHPGAALQGDLRATADHAEYEAAGEWLHLTGSPRVVDSGMEVTAQRVDVSRSSGDAFARGDVRASWMNAKSSPTATVTGIGAQGPVHAVAEEMQLHQATGEGTFRRGARLWQQGNSVAAPVIVLDRLRHTLLATSGAANDPVRAVLVSDSGAASKKGPTVVRLKGGELSYSDVDRKGTMKGGALKQVTAEMPLATSLSDTVEIALRENGTKANGKNQVEEILAAGRVNLTSQGRRGMGDLLRYNGETGEYVLTGSGAVPPKISDPGRGWVTGASLIFDGRNDSVRIEGGVGGKSHAESRSPR